MILDELKGRGFEFKKHANCQNCGDEIEWWVSPAGNWLPYNPMSKGSDEAVFHGKTCSNPVRKGE
jgi:hypothetical protein